MPRNTDNQAEKFKHPSSITARDATRIAFDIAFSGQDRLTPDEIGLICPACAKSMRAKHIRWVRGSVVRSSLFSQPQE